MDTVVYEGHMASLSINTGEGGGNKADLPSGASQSQPYETLTADAMEEEEDVEDEHNSLQDSSLLYGTFSTMPRSPATDAPLGCCGFFTKLMAVFIAAYITLVDNVPYGLLIFPPEMKLNMLGIQMVVWSAFVSQVVFCFFSAFPSALGSNIIENVVFLRTISGGVALKLQAAGRLDRALSTMVTIFVLSTLLTGIAFYLLGLMQLGKISSFVPRHVLLGCIGGMGMFIATQGVGISTNVPWSFRPHDMLAQFTPWDTLAKSGTTILLTVGLSLVRVAFRNTPVLTPVYFFLVPALFFLLLYLLGISRQDAADAGWLFSFHDAPAPAPSSSSPSPSSISMWSTFLGGQGWAVAPACQSFPGVLSCLSLKDVDWDLVTSNMFTLAAIVFFSIIHVPVNVPALSSTTGLDADLNEELKSHGLSNLLSGLTGGLQNYMAYSTSALYYKTGGGGKVSSLVVASLLLVFLGLGPSAIEWFPRPLAGCLLLHLGTVLLWESLVEPWERGVDVFEYATIATITLCMVVIGFMEGLGIGVLLACCSFVVQGSLVNPIAAAFLGDGLRSREMRTSEERKVLDLRMQGVVYVVRLRGSLFFGNAEQVYLHLREVLHTMSANPPSSGSGGASASAKGFTSGGGKGGSLQFVILDLEDVGAIDYHAKSRMARTSKLVTDSGVRLVWSQLGDGMRRALRKAGCFGPLRHGNSRDHHFCGDLNEAFSYVEMMVLHRYMPRPSLSKPVQRRKSQQTPTSAENAAGVPEEGEQPGLHPLPPTVSYFLLSMHKLTSEALGEGEGEGSGVLERLEKYFVRQSVEEGCKLWRRNDPPHMAILLEQGLLGVPKERMDPAARASLAQLPPASVRSHVPAHYPCQLCEIQARHTHSHSHSALPSHLPMSPRSSGGLSSSLGVSFRLPLGLPSPLGSPHGHGEAWPERFLEVSRPGQMSGELGLFTKELRKYTLVAVEPSVIWTVDTGALNAMMSKDPQCYIVLLRLALRYASHRLHSLMLVGQLHSV